MDEMMVVAARKTGNRYLGVTLTVAFVGVWLAMLPYPMVILPMLAERISPTDKAAVLARALGIGSFIGLIAQPIFGVLSDHTRSRWGMRKPWILGGMLGGLGAMAVMATARTPAQLALGWGLMALTFNSTLSGLNAVLPDQVRSEKLGVYSSLVSSRRRSVCCWASGSRGNWRPTSSRSRWYRGRSRWWRLSASSC